MNELTFHEPDASPEPAARASLSGYLRSGETKLNGGALLEQMPYVDWIYLTREKAAPETVHENWVVTSMFFERDGCLVEIGDIRNSLNDSLRKYGVGYVR